MLLKSSTVQLAQPIENDDEIFLLHCGEAKAFMGRGCNHGINHSLWEMYQQHIHIEGCGTSYISVLIRRSVCILQCFIKLEYSMSA